MRHRQICPIDSLLNSLEVFVAERLLADSKNINLNTTQSGRPDAKLPKIIKILGNDNPLLRKILISILPNLADLMLSFPRLSKILVMTTRFFYFKLTVLPA